MSDWTINGLSRLLSWQPAAAPAQSPAQPTEAANVDLSALTGGPVGHGSPAEQVFGCRCSTNPSGLSPAEIAAAQAQNLQGQPQGQGPSRLPGFLS